MKIRRFLFACVLAISLGGMLAAITPATPVFAQAGSELAAVGKTIKLPSTDPRIIAARVINVALSLIGLVLVVLILYGGFLYMTAGGEAEKTKTARKIITNAIIGLIIILSAWAITRFVIDRLLKATGEEGGAIVTSGGSGLGGFGAGGTSTAFRVVSITPAGTVPIRNVQVKIVFNKTVDDAGAAAITIRKEAGATVGGIVAFDGQVVTFTPSQTCPAPHADKNCFDANTSYIVNVSASIRSTSGQTVACGALKSSCEGKFKSGSLIDTSPPTVAFTYPVSGQSVSANSIVQLFADATDDSGVATVQFFDAGHSIGIDAPSGGTPQKEFSAKLDWITSAASLGIHTLTAVARDLNTNVSPKSSISVVVRSEKCFNGILDPPYETGIDCGGDPSRPEYCGACSAGACVKDTDCASGTCRSGTCVAQPIIKGISPSNGKRGTSVTISGINFGYTPGKVVFLGGPGASDDAVAVAPVACKIPGVITWKNDQVVVAVPDAAVSGPIQIENAASGLKDVTKGNFVVDTTERPGVCGVVPSSGSSGSEAELIGTGFGSSAGKVRFGGTDLIPTGWVPERARFRIPVVGIGPYPVSVKTGIAESNEITFDVREKSFGATPVIDSVDPIEGAAGQYVTLFGRFFGSSLGKVEFVDATSRIAPGDTSFPSACGAGFWRDDRIVIKFPSKFTGGAATEAGKYKVRLTRSDGAVSNDASFTLNLASKITPGICAIQPALGPIGTKVRMSGDGFVEKPLVTFYSGKAALVSDAFTAREIDTTVPAGALTGPVSLTVAGVSSNKVQFAVQNCNTVPDACSPSEHCCSNGVCLEKDKSCGAVSQSAEYAWVMSTGLIPVAPEVIEECKPGAKPGVVPSPSPWSERAGGNDAPITSAIVMRFTRALDKTTVNDKTIRLFRCTSSSGDACTKTVAVSGVTIDQKPSGGEHFVKLIHPAFAISTTYLVTVSTAVKADGVGGATMTERKECGKDAAGGTLGYCFRFRTSASTSSASIGSVVVVPSPYTMTGAFQTADYEAVPLDASSACIVLDCSQYTWDWYTGKKTATSVTPDARAKIDNKAGACESVVTGVDETGAVPVLVNARVSDSFSFIGTGQLFIKFVPPHVESYAPNCELACSNALVWARFSDAMDAKNFSVPGTVEIAKCKNENCFETELAAPFTLGKGISKIMLMTTFREAHIFPASPFEIGAFYRVLLKSGIVEPTGIRGKNGMPLTGLNHPHGFQWKFRVMTGPEASCAAQRVDVVPIEKYETQIDARQLFVATAVSAPDACSADGQALVSSGSATWESTRTDVARLWTIGGSLVDTGATLPPGCSGACLATGAVAQFGKVGVCGNKIIETTDAKFCVAGKTPQGFPCTLLPAGSQAGEECEPSLAGDICDPTTCLFLPVKAVTAGGTCGNGKVDVANGEACDPGLTCKGATSSTSPVPDGSLCDTPATKIACESAGGVCGVFARNGCSSGCRKLGASSGISTCGNGDVGAGEDCDDGNLTDGDGCSSQCLHEGSRPLKELYAVCGNGILEPGEVCESATPGGPLPVGCDPKTCLHTGTTACTGGTKTNCCGNEKIDPGEDCDDGNSKSGDGCSSSCLFEGSSPAYSDPIGAPSPSFCGNGVLEQGEQCEAGAPSNEVASKAARPLVFSGTGDGKVDPVQLALITGTAKPDPDGRMRSEIKVGLDGKAGVATYGLQCGFTSEKSCTDEFGLDDNGCCTPRPQLATRYPEGKDVCRNVQIKVVWKEPMDTASVISNFEISQEKPLLGCPPGTREVLAESSSGSGFWARLGHLWSRFIAVLTGHPVLAGKWCTGAVTGELASVGATGTTFILNLDASLAPKTTYRIRFIGDHSTTTTDPLLDNADKEKKIGVKTARGVVRRNDNDDTGPVTWTFETGKEICAVNVVLVSDVQDDIVPPVPPDVAHPNLFINKNNKEETRHFLAQAASIQSGIAIPLSSTGEYAWSWAPWSTSNGKIVTVENTKPSGATVAATSKQTNGTVMLTATLDISKDTVNVPPTKGGAVQGVLPVTVLVCENPWPSLTDAPFRDEENSPNFKPGDLFYKMHVPKPLYYNFATAYCRDAGTKGTFDNLPALKINQVEQTPLDAASGILRQYLFTYPKEDDLPKPFRGKNLQADGIGIRIISNPQHLSPQEWYATRGFIGSPSPLDVDGYPAIQDGTTIYVAASNRPKGSAGKIYSNIYLISHNENANEVTLQIFHQMVALLTFNINKEFVEQSNVCVRPTTILGKYSVYATTTVNGGEPLSCSTDAECLAFGIENLHCDSDKLKITRDTKRLADFQQIANALEKTKSAGGTFGRYPDLTGGTFLPNASVSLWSSWKKELGQALATTLPVDPVNRFLTCGRCETSGVPCERKEDCPQSGGAVEICKGGTYKIDPTSLVPVWTPDNNIDPQSCWNQKSRVFTCPRIPGAGSYGVSRMYRYTSQENGARYDLGAEFELPPADLAEWWSPPLAQGIYRCINPGSFGAYCANGSGSGPDANLCRPCPGGNCKTCQAGPRKGFFCPDPAYCADGGKSYDCTDVFPPAKSEYCKQFGGTFSFKDICVNTTVGEGGVCGDGVLNTRIDPSGAKVTELCEVGMTRLEPCEVPITKAKGHKLQVCDLTSCAKFIDDPSRTRCIADVACGNGRIDKKCSVSGLGCLADADCGSGGGTCLAAEVCDDGSLNGTYGRCNTTCDGYAGYCGDGIISPGEVCDEGKDNGVYGGKCGFDCKGPGPYCGDGLVNGGEECDGETETTQGPLCSYKFFVPPPPAIACKTDADCTLYIDKDKGVVLTFGECGKTPTTKACVGVKESVKLKDASGVETTLVYDTQHTRTCRKPGDPKQCTLSEWSECKAKGSCGDGIKDAGEECDDGPGNGDTRACTSVCKKNVCGDGKTLVGVEECDKGADNGKVTCTADYDSICLSCSTACKFLAVAGGYCGDGVKNGPEQCDGKEGLAGVTCASIGFDYGLTPIKSTSEPEKTTGKCRLYRETDYFTKEGLALLQSFIRSEKSCKTDDDCDDGTGMKRSEAESKKVPWWQAGGAKCVADVPSCTTGCSFGGCLRCTDPPDPLLTMELTGTVRDGIYSNQPVPNARVTLLYKGVKVSETATNANGDFTLKNVNSISACSAYRLVVDSYDDNPCTGKGSTRPSCAGQPWTIDNVDESVNGGYWPFTSQPFNASNFATVGLENASSVIFLLPRVRKYETLVTVNWLGNLKELAPSSKEIDDIDAHTIFPIGYAFKTLPDGGGRKTPFDLTNPENFFEDYVSCTLGSKNCLIDLQYSTPGLNNLAHIPHARMYCYKFGKSDEDCTNFEKSPEVIKYTRLYLSSGDIQFYLVDFGSHWQTKDYNFTKPLKLFVNVVTEEGVTTYRPKDGKFGKVWHVFSQEGGSGALTFRDEWITAKEATETHHLTNIGP